MSIFEPLELLASWLSRDLIGLQAESLEANALEFFIADTLKIFILLSVIIFAVALIRTFLPPARLGKLLAGRNGLGYVLAGSLGIVTPFCTCSAIPLFLGLIEAGVPLGITFTFLLASPMINEVALALILGMFGWKVAGIYVASGFTIAILSGLIISRLRPEKLLKNKLGQGSLDATQYLSFKQRLSYASTYLKEMLQYVWIYVLIGIGLGALIHGYVPTDFLARYAGQDNFWAVPFATLLGVPLYANAAAIVPLVSVLSEKGVSLGTSLAFMMAVTGLSLPEFMILRKVMQTKLILIFIGIVTVGIIFTGYLFNFILA